MIADDTDVASTSAPAEGEISIRISSIRRFLVTVVLVTGFVSAIGLWVDTQFGGETIGKIVGWIDVNSESNVPTWFSMMLLAGAGVLAGTIGLARHRVGTTKPHQWLALGALLVAMSVDEVVQLHEEFNRVGDVLDLGGIFVFAWVIPGSLFVLFAGGVFLPFLRTLPTTVRWGIIAAGGLFIAGALGLEFVEASVVTQRAGEHGVVFESIGTVQEVMEMLGVVWLIHVLLGVLATRPPLRVAVGD